MKLSVKAVNMLFFYLPIIAMYTKCMECLSEGGWQKLIVNLHSSRKNCNSECSHSVFISTHPPVEAFVRNFNYKANGTPLDLWCFPEKEHTNALWMCWGKMNTCKYNMKECIISVSEQEGFCLSSRLIFSYGSASWDPMARCSGFYSIC